MDLKTAVRTVIFILALVTTIWFLLFGWNWTYGGALYIAYPAGVLSLPLWLLIKNATLTEAA